VALILLRVLDLLAPWRWGGDESTRDVWRVQLVYRLFPWTLPHWKARSAALARQYANQPLLDVLKRRPTPPVIITVGFMPIVVPLVNALGLGGARIVGSRLNGFSDRRLGKLHIARAALGEETLRRALVVTDSRQDLPLLAVCAKPVLTVWPEARYRRAFSGIYLPGQYISEVKRPGKYYFRRAVLQEDYILWVLSSLALSPVPFHHVAGLLLLLCSFWIIYERGYVDNDLTGVRLEKNPKLSEAFYHAPVATPFWPPWIWSAAAAAAAVAILRGPSWRHWTDWARWEAVLVATYLWFYWYNRTEESKRVWMFAILQFARTVAFVSLLPVTPVGAMALGAHVLARWTPYYLYRRVDKTWPENTSIGLIRVLFFVVMALLLGVSEGWASIVNWTAVILLAWNLLRARYDLRPREPKRDAAPNVA
jgi:hypothetical protein